MHVEALSTSTTYKTYFRPTSANTKKYINEDVNLVIGAQVVLQNKTTLLLSDNVLQLLFTVCG